MKILISPSKYIQGKNALGELSRYGKALGRNLLVLADDFVMKMTRGLIEEGNTDAAVTLTFERFTGECSRSEVDRILGIAREKGADVIVGVGGGKTLDTAKAVAHFGKLPVVIAPTIASTDAPTSALSVLYTDDGVFDEYLLLPRNPDIVLVDTEIIVRAPTRLLVSGMGDALATYYEARVCYGARKTAMCGGQPTMAAMALATLCRDTLFKSGYLAKLSSDANIASEAFEEVVEANTLLSGLGFESTGLAAAHAIHNGFTVLKEAHGLYHGEKVAFGTIAQLVLENAAPEEIEQVIEFCQSLGLPTTLEELGITEGVEEKIREVAAATCAEGETIHNFPYVVTPEMVFNAILLADRLGQG